MLAEAEESHARSLTGCGCQAAVHAEHRFPRLVRFVSVADYSRRSGPLRAPGQRGLPPLRHSRLRRARRDDAGGGPCSRGGARRARRRQGTGAHRRARQGRRRQARRRARRRRGEGARDPRARHPRARRAPALDRARGRDREGVLPLGHVRPQRAEAAAHVHDARRGRDRAGRGRDARGARCACTSTRSRATSPTTAGGSSTAPGSATPSEQRQIAAIVERLYRCFVESDAMLCEINPLIVTAGGRGRGARREGDGRRLRALPPSRARGAARHERRRPARGVRAREGRHVREARRLGRDPRQRRRALDGDRRRGRRRRRAARRTSATSAAAARPRASSTRSR